LRYLNQREWENKMLAKKLKSALVGSGMLAGALFTASAAVAGPIALPGGAGLNLQLNGEEQVNGANSDTCTLCGAGPVPAYNGSQSAAAGNNEGLWGVFIINNIAPALPIVPNSELAQSGAPFFTNAGGPGSPGQQILAVFYGGNVTHLGAPSTAQYGVIDLYWWDKNVQSDFNTASTGGAALRDNGGVNSQFGSGYAGYSCGSPAPVGASGCQLLAEFDLVAENAPGGGNTSQYSVGDVTTAAGGAGYFEAEVDPTKGGAWANQLAADYFSLNNPALLSLPMNDASDLNGVADSRACLPTFCGLGWTGQPGTTVRVSDPVQLFTKVPEPGTLSLF
jgi:hypothetical protein